MAVVDALRAADPAAFQWKTPPYEYEHDKIPVDVIAGSPEFRLAIDAGERAEQIAERWQPTLAEFDVLRREYLLY
jgi:hypothetical protein